jgi:hypothetical protein
MSLLFILSMNFYIFLHEFLHIFQIQELSSKVFLGGAIMYYPHHSFSLFDSKICSRGEICHFLDWNSLREQAFLCDKFYLCVIEYKIA